MAGGARIGDIGPKHRLARKAPPLNLYDMIEKSKRGTSGHCKSLAPDVRMYDPPF